MTARLLARRTAVAVPSVVVAVLERDGNPVAVTGVIVAFSVIVVPNATGDVLSAVSTAIVVGTPTVTLAVPTELATFELPLNVAVMRREPNGSADVVTDAVAAADG
jgi:hypothetical protein